MCSRKNKLNFRVISVLPDAANGRGERYGGVAVVREGQAVVITVSMNAINAIIV